MAAARSIFKWTAIGFGALLLLAGLLFAGFGVVMTRVPAYRAQMQAWLSERAKLDIEFGDLSARWRWYGPQLVFDHAVLRSADRQRTLAVAERGGIGFDIWAALRTGRLSAVQFYLSGAEFQVVRTPEGKFAVIGQEELPQLENVESLQADNLPIGHLEVRNVRLLFRDLRTGRGPWEVRDVDFDIDRDTRRVDVDGRAMLPAALGKELRFKAHSDGSLKEVEVLPWQAELDGLDLDLAGWAQAVPEEWSLAKGGRGGFQLSGEFRGSALQSWRGQLDFSQVRLALPQWSIPLPQADVLQIRDDTEPAAGEKQRPTPQSEAPPPAAPPASASTMIYSRVAASFQGERSDQAWHAVIKQLQLSRAEAPWQPSEAELTVSKLANDGLRVESSASLLVLDDIWPLLAYLPENEQRANLRALNASGNLGNLKLEFSRDAAEAPWRYQLSADLSRIAVSAIGKSPGFTSLSGKLAANESQGRMAIDSQDFLLALPRLFRTPLPADKLAGTVTWRRSENAWQIDGENIGLDNGDGHARGRLSLQLPDEGSPVIDLQAEANDLNAVSAPRYMPAGILSGKLLDWLDSAFTAGHVANAEFTLRGPLRNFPFRHDEGLFLIKAHIDGLALNYQRGWMPASDVSVDAEFRNAGLTAVASGGQVNGLQVSNVVGRFKDFQTSEFELKATCEGELQQALDFLQQSSIGPALGDTFQALQGGGALHADVNLWLPLKQISKYKLDVGARLADGRVALKGWEQQAESVNGGLRVREQGISDVTLSGKFLQGPFAVTTAPAAAESPAMFIASGHVPAGPLSTFLHVPAFVKLSGETDWRLETSGVRAMERGKKLVTMTSDLQGLGIGLPAPLRKRETEARTLRMEAETGADNSLLLRTSLGNVRSLLRMQKQAGGWSFDRGSVRADGLAASLPANSGLRIEGSLDDFALDDWLRLSSGDGAGSGNGPAVNEILRAANVTIGRFHWYGFTWPEVRAVLQATDKAWQVDVTGPQAAGQLLIPYRVNGPAPLNLNFDHLALTREPAAGGAERSTPDPRDLPALQADIKQLEYGEHNFGELQLQADKTPQGLQVKMLRVASPALTAVASGSWLVGADGQTGSLLVDLESSDLRSAMQQLNYADFIAANHGKVHADLRWPGSIDENILGRASGAIELQVDDGQLLNVQPGAGRILGLLSIAALPRRLSLDFRDLTDKGLRFDSIHADFKVKDGDALTENFLLRGPAADIGVAGRLGLAKHDYDQRAIVTGQVGSALPLAGAAIAANPVVGAALLLFTQIFKEPLKGVARGYYHITGGWDNPMVERIDAEEAAKESKDLQPSVETAK